MRTFLDTNVLLYAYDREEPEKQHIARSVLRAGSELLVVSTQVLAEFFWVATRKLRRPLPEDQAARAVEYLCGYTVIGADADLVLSAIELARERRIASWDALIVRAAQVGGCERLLTEDLRDGATFGALRVVNPFRDL